MNLTWFERQKFMFTYLENLKQYLKQLNNPFPILTKDSVIILTATPWLTFLDLDPKIPVLSRSVVNRHSARHL